MKNVLAIDDGREPEIDGKRRLAMALESIQLESAKVQNELLQLESAAVKSAISKTAWREQKRLLEERSSALMCKYVAASRLFNCSGMDSALEAVSEILENLIGVCRFALYLPRGDGEAPATGSEKMDEEISREKSGKPIAWVPLQRKGRSVGGIAIFELLPQKTDFESADLQIFEFLSEHAAETMSLFADRSGQAQKSFDAKLFCAVPSIGRGDVDRLINAAQE